MTASQRNRSFAGRWFRCLIDYLIANLMAILRGILHNASIVNERDHPHRPFALRTFKRIDFINLLDQPRPRRFGTDGDFRRRLRLLRYRRGLLEREDAQAIGASRLTIIL